MSRIGRFIEAFGDADHDLRLKFSRAFFYQLVVFRPMLFERVHRKTDTDFFRTVLRNLVILTGLGVGAGSRKKNGNDQRE